MSATMKRRIEWACFRPTDGGNNRTAIFTADEACWIVRLHAFGFSIEQLTAMFDCVDDTIKNVVNGRRIIRLAVRLEYRRQGFASLMLDAMRLKIKQNPGLKELICEIRESDLPMQLLLRANHIKAIEVLWDYFDEPNEDGYLFRVCD